MSKNLPDIWSQRIERQLDNLATGTQNREYLRNDDDSEPLAREMVRLNFEQFVRLYCLGGK